MSVSSNYFSVRGLNDSLNDAGVLLTSKPAAMASYVHVSKHRSAMQDKNCRTSNSIKLQRSNAPTLRRRSRDISADLRCCLDVPVRHASHLPRAETERYTLRCVTLRLRKCPRLEGIRSRVIYRRALYERLIPHGIQSGRSKAPPSRKSERTWSDLNIK